MRLIHNVLFTPQEIEFYRQLVFSNLIQGLKSLLDAMSYLELEASQECHQYIRTLDDAPDLKDGQAFPMEYHQPLTELLQDGNVQKALQRGNEAALPEKCISTSLSRYRCWRMLFLAYPISFLTWIDCSRATIALQNRISSAVGLVRLALLRRCFIFEPTRCLWLTLEVRNLNDENGYIAFKM